MVGHPQKAVELGALLAQNGVGLVFGGGNVGLMGTVAATAHNHGGQVLGVIPKALWPRELSGSNRVGVQEVVPDMHTRKQRMGFLCDAYIALPGGYGTFEELLEVLAWSQLGIHRKSIGILNVDGFYDPLLQLFDGAFTQGFIAAEFLKSFVFDSEPAALLEKMRQHEPPLGLTSWDAVGLKNL